MHRLPVGFITGISLLEFLLAVLRELRVFLFDFGDGKVHTIIFLPEKIQ